MSQPIIVMYIPTRSTIDPARGKHYYAPTLNEYAQLDNWQRTKIRRAILNEIDAYLAAGWVYGNQRADMGVKRMPGRRGMLGKLVSVGKGRKRIVEVIRKSGREPDEISADSIGGKIPIDQLVRAGILVDDSPKWCERKAHWVRADGKYQTVIVSVWEAGEYEG